MKKTALYILPGVLAAGCLAWFLVIPAFSGRLAIPMGFSVAGFEVRYYGMTLAAAALIGYLVSRKFSERFGLTKTQLDDLAFWAIIGGFIGARAYIVAFDWNYFQSDFSEAFKVWHGGLSIYGSLMGGIAAIYLWCGKNISLFRSCLDLAALGLPLAQAVGRWGNFINQEAFGLPTNLPWKMYVSPAFRPAFYADYEFFHPTFLYESLLLALVFMALTYFLKHPLKPGVLAFLYLGLYSVIRFFIEPLRLDNMILAGFRINQVAALAALLISGILIIRWQLVSGGQDLPATANDVENPPEN